MTLQRGTMSVVEYDVKFDQLSLYATSLIAIEWAKYIKFEGALRYEVWYRITP